MVVRAYRGRDEQTNDESHVSAGRSRQQCVVPLDMVFEGVHRTVLSCQHQSLITGVVKSTLPDHGVVTCRGAMRVRRTRGYGRTLWY